MLAHFECAASQRKQSMRCVGEESLGFPIIHYFEALEHRPCMTVLWHPGDADVAAVLNSCRYHVSCVMLVMGKPRIRLTGGAGRGCGGGSADGQ